MVRRSKVEFGGSSRSMDSQVRKKERKKRNRLVGWKFLKCPNRGGFSVVACSEGRGLDVPTSIFMDPTWVKGTYLRSMILGGMKLGKKIYY